MKISSFAGILIIIFGSVLALIFGKALLFPFLVALLIYFLIRSIRRFIDRSPVLKKNVPAWIKNLISSFFIFSLIGFTVEMLILNSKDLIESYIQYQPNIDKILLQMNDVFGVDISEKIGENLKNIDLNRAINPLISSLTGFMGSFMMVLFYLLFLFIEESSFKMKLHLVFSKPEKFQDTKQLLMEIEHSITHYIGLKTLVSFISSVICFIIFLSFGIDSAILWAFIVFIMNFIPIIGPLLAVFLPTFFAMIQFGEISIPLIMMFILGSTQTIIGNIIEPRIMGNSLNISPLVALLSLSFWGAIWGVTGMLVSVPITVILIILLAHFPKTKSIAILLSHHGKID